MSEKDYENVLKHLAPADLQQQFDKTADALEKITKMYFDMKAKNEALMEALRDCLILIDNEGLSLNGILRKKVTEAMKEGKE